MSREYTRIRYFDRVTLEEVCIGTFFIEDKETILERKGEEWKPAKSAAEYLSVYVTTDKDSCSIVVYDGYWLDVEGAEIPAGKRIARAMVEEWETCPYAFYEPYRAYMERRKAAMYGQYRNAYVEQQVLHRADTLTNALKWAMDNPSKTC